MDSKKQSSCSVLGNLVEGETENLNESLSTSINSNLMNISHISSVSSNATEKNNLNITHPTSGVSEVCSDQVTQATVCSTLFLKIIFRHLLDFQNLKNVPIFTMNAFNLVASTLD